MTNKGLEERIVKRKANQRSLYLKYKGISDPVERERVNHELFQTFIATRDDPEKVTDFNKAVERFIEVNEALIRDFVNDQSGIYGKFENDRPGENRFEQNLLTAMTKVYTAAKKVDGSREPEFITYILTSIKREIARSHGFHPLNKMVVYAIEDFLENHRSGFKRQELREYLEQYRVSGKIKMKKSSLTSQMCMYLKYNRINLNDARPAELTRSELILDKQIDHRTTDPLEILCNEHDNLSDDITKAWNCLKPVQKKVLHYRVNGYKLKEIGFFLGFTKERVRQILTQDIGPKILSHFPEGINDASVFLRDINSLFQSDDSLTPDPNFPLYFLKDSIDFPTRSMTEQIMRYRSGDVQAVGEMFVLTKALRESLERPVGSIYPVRVHYTDIQTQLVDVLYHVCKNFNLDMAGDDSLKKYFTYLAFRNTSWLTKVYPFLRRSNVSHPEVSLKHEPDVADPIQEMIEKEDTEKKVTRLLDNLKPVELEILHGTLNGKRSYEIGEELHMTDANVWQRMHRIKQKLKYVMDPSIKQSSMADIREAVSKYYTNQHRGYLEKPVYRQQNTENNRVGDNRVDNRVRISA